MFYRHAHKYTHTYTHISNIVMRLAVGEPDNGARSDDVPDPSIERSPLPQGPKVPSETFHAAKSGILVLLGATYLVAFLGAWLQNGALMSSRGLVPAAPHFEEKQRLFAGDPFGGFTAHPSVFWFVSLTDENMERVELLGVALSCLTVLGLCSWAALATLWILYFSIVTTAEATSFYQYAAQTHFFFLFQRVRGMR